MKRKNKYDKPDSTGFIRYLKGEMTPGERNLFERELQRDPFAQEAMEGMGTLPARDINHDLVFLQQKINHRRKRRVRYTYYRVAASIAVLMIISSIFYVVEKDKGSEQPSLTQYNQAPMEIAKAEPVRKSEDEAEPESRPSSPAPSRQKKAIAAVENTDESQEMAVEIQKEPEKIEPRQETQLSKKNAVSQMPVLAEEAEAAQPAAAVRSQVRYNSGVPAGKGAEGPVQLKIAVAGDSTAIYSPPQPVNGREEYERYFNDHITRPDSATIGQRVVVVAAFKIRKNGLPDSIRIIRSPDRRFSDEVLRVIRSAPSWKPAIRNGIPVDEEVSLSIVFR